MRPRLFRMHNRTWRRGRRGVALLTVFALAVGCTGGSGGDTAEPTGEATPATARGGTLRVGILDNFPGNWDLQAGGPAGNISTYARLVSRTLLSYRAGSTQDGGTVLRPDLATDLPEISADGLTWTFHLRPGIRWGPPLQDVEITASDFVRSFERLLDPAVTGVVFGSYWASLYPDVIEGGRAYANGDASSITGLEAPDAHTLRIGLTAPNGDFGYLVAMWPTAPIPPSPSDPTAHYGAAQGHDGDYGGFWVSSGPYMLSGSDEMDFSLPPIQQLPVSGITADAVTLVRNPSWDPATDDLRPAAVDSMVFTPMDGNVRPPVLEKHVRSAVEGGDLDVVLDWEAAPAVEDYRADPTLRDRLAVAPTDSMYYVGINLALPPFDDVHMRRALNLVLDKAAIVKGYQALFGDTGVVLDHGGLDGLEGNILAGYDPYPTPGHHGNLGRARREVSKSRYDSDGDGRCDAAGCVHVSAIARGDPLVRAGQQAVVDGLANLGVEVDLEADDDAFYGSYGRPGTHFALRILDGYSKDYPSAGTLYPQFLGSGFIGGCCNEYMVGASPAQLRRYDYPVQQIPNADDRIAACQRQVFQAEVRCWADLDRYLMEQVIPWVPIATRLTARIVSDRVDRFVMAQTNPLAWPALDQAGLSREEAAESVPLPESSPRASGVASTIPEGAYTATVTEEQVDAIGAGDPYEQHGDFSLTLSQGRWSLAQVSDHELLIPFLAGSYSGSGHDIEFVSDERFLTASDRWTMVWSERGGSISFSVLRSSVPDGDSLTPFAVGPWTPA